ncbi:MAG: S41 family peptidase [bacterium]
MSKLKFTALLFVAFSIQLFSQNNSPLVRFPALNPDGSKIAFSYQGDIWTVPSSGGAASRLTIHEAYESNPKWSIDGKSIAFSGDRFGNNDIFVITTEGGAPKRITYNSAGDAVSCWTNDGNLLFTTSREFKQVERELEIYSVSSKGGASQRILDALGYEPRLSPNGRYIAFVRRTNTVFREDYKGPANRDIWIYDTKLKAYSKISPSESNDFNPVWKDNNTLYYVSAESGRYNIYKIKIGDDGKANGNPEAITNYKDEAVRCFDVSADGSKLVFEKDENVYLMNTEDGSSQKVKINVADDNRFDPYEFKTFSKDATEYKVSPNGKYSAIVIHGEIFVMENDKEKNRAINLSNHPYRDMNVDWLSDSTIVFISDREGQYDLYLVRSADENQTNIFKTLKREVIRLTNTDVDETNPVISPDGKQITFLRGAGELIVAAISADGKLSNEKKLLEGWATPSGISWSPDSKWLAYSISDLYFNDEIFIHAADNSQKSVNISMHPRGDYSPVWSADGSKLGFLSGRNNRNNDVWFVWLNKEDWQKTKQDWDEKDDSEKKEDKKDKDKDSIKVKPIKIDLENIHERLTQVTSLPGDESNIAISKDGETFFYVAKNSSADGSDLYSVKWNGKDVKEMTKGGANPGGVSTDKEGKYVYYFKSGGTLNRIEAKGDKSETLPYNAKMKIDYNVETEQIYEEAWRAIRDNFYDPQFHGNDWETLHDKYKSRCLKASTKNDFREMFNYMLGELNASHMGMYGSDKRIETQTETTGQLGVELIPTGNGMKVLRVIPNTPADREKSKLSVDDVIVSVDGNPFDTEADFYSLLTNKVDEKTILEVKGKDGAEREVIIRPVSNIRNELYEEWVKERRKLTDKYSGGRLGYVHIEGMSIPSFEIFERELTAAGEGKEGLVIDVRFNGGGWTTDYLMTVLNYKQHAYTIPRGATDNLERDHKKFRDYYPLGERLIFSAWLKPSITLCNEDSYSNAEIFSHAYKTLGLGTLVGMPTNGSVISTGGKDLIDGSMVRLPGRGWYVKATDKNEELGPAVPDIIVENTPDAKAKGEDQQLKTAVDELLKQIDSKK